MADLPFPRAVHDELISDGRAEPHRYGYLAVVSYYIREPEDVPGAVELFRMNYDRVLSRNSYSADLAGDVGGTVRLA